LYWLVEGLEWLVIFTQLLQGAQHYSLSAWHVYTSKLQPHNIPAGQPAYEKKALLPQQQI